MLRRAVAARWRGTWPLAWEVRNKALVDRREGERTLSVSRQSLTTVPPSGHASGPGSVRLGVGENGPRSPVYARHLSALRTASCLH